MSDAKTTGTTTCVHREQIESVGDGFQHGTCKICNQVRQYSIEGPKVTKLGRINGAIVLPGAKENLFLSVEEAAELDAAKKALVSVTAPPAVRSAIPATEQPSQSGKQWYNKHKKEMIEDLLTMDKTAFEEKWKVKRQIISHLKSDKLYKSRMPQAGTPRRKMSKRLKEVPALDPLLSGRGRVDKLPSYPVWAPEKWGSDKIAIQWLRTYEALQRMLLIHALSLKSLAIPESKEAQRVSAKRSSWLSRLFKRQ